MLRCTQNWITAASSSDSSTIREESGKIRVCNYCFKQWQQGGLADNDIQVSNLDLNTSPSAASYISTKSVIIRENESLKPQCRNESLSSDLLILIPRSQFVPVLFKSKGAMAAPSFNWWRKDAITGTPVVVKMENPNNWSMEHDFLNVGVSKGHNKNAKQLTWVLLLKAHRAAGCITSVAPATFFLASSVRRRLSAAGILKTSTPVYSCVKVFLLISILLLGFELAAYFRGWHFGAPDLHFGLRNPFAFKGLFDSVYSSWVLIRVGHLAPGLQGLANGCIYLFLIQSLG
ncbi:hypothetical protein L1987_13753 [Smallanthus sonchifolius]|uniref:Uncharacterized protein n=1 Tax=Smallanthus sonchifolius TaxID=185202 RepID=A0ACB9JHY0_9ASTR|nr:hypothetical protein L1987_13753 [Smallanthus sonchifolius]